MHELSIAHSLVGLVQERLPAGATRVLAVDLRIGALSGVVRGALEFCYEIATAGTLLEGSALRVTELPVVIHCPDCQADRPLEGTFVFRCPVCGTLSGDIRQGRELDVAAIEYDAAEETAS
ncbi:MAG: hydrogenase maturation nickel metallochaperone HypA [Acidobacteriota bacterium]|nr:hydrogenase maturation nickel metallochaperone HypA [Acidobacteriota bacterium]